MTLIALWFRQTKEEKNNLEELHFKRELLEALQRLPISFGKMCYDPPIINANPLTP